MTEWPRIRGIDHVQFDREPRAGQTVAVRCHRPIPSESFWTLYLPIESFINGWEDYPEQLLESRLVRLTPAADRFLVEESIAFPDLARYFGTPNEGVAPQLPPRQSQFSIAGFKVIDGNLEGDVVGYLVIQTIANEEILLIHGYSEFGNATFEAGAMRLITR